MQEINAGVWVYPAFEELWVSVVVEQGMERIGRCCSGRCGFQARVKQRGALTAVPCNWNQSSGFLVVGRGLSWGLIGENVVVVVWIEVGDDDEANCCK